MITADGVKRGTGVRRLADCDCWVADGWDALQGLPWEVTARRSPSTEHATCRSGWRSRCLGWRAKDGGATSSSCHGATYAEEDLHPEGRRREVHAYRWVPRMHMHLAGPIYRVTTHGSMQSQDCDSDATR